MSEFHFFYLSASFVRKNFFLIFGTLKFFGMVEIFQSPKIEKFQSLEKCGNWIFPIYQLVLEEDSNVTKEVFNYINL